MAAHQFRFFPQQSIKDYAEADFAWYFSPVSLSRWMRLKKLLYFYQKIFFSCLTFWILIWVLQSVYQNIQLNRDIAKTQQLIALQKKEVDLAKHLQQQIQQTKILTQLFEKQAIYLKDLQLILQWLSQIVQPGIILKKIEIQAKKVSMTGFASTPQQLSQWIEALQKITSWHIASPNFSFVHDEEQSSLSDHQLLFTIWLSMENVV